MTVSFNRCSLAGGSSGHRRSGDEGSDNLLVEVLAVRYVDLGGPSSVAQYDRPNGVLAEHIHPNDSTCRTEDFEPGRRVGSREHIMCLDEDIVVAKDGHGSIVTSGLPRSLAHPGGDHVTGNRGLSNAFVSEASCDITSRTTPVPVLAPRHQRRSSSGKSIECCTRTARISPIAP